MYQLIFVDGRDDRHSRLKDSLEAEGIRIRVARCNSEALQMARQDSPDLVLAEIFTVDVDVDGFELRSQWQAHNQPHSIPVILYTADSVSDKDGSRWLVLQGSDASQKLLTTAQLTFLISTRLREGDEALRDLCQDRSFREIGQSGQTPASASASQENDQQPVLPGSSRFLARMALAVGAATVLLSFVFGALAYQYSRSAVLDIVADQNLATSQSVVNTSLALLDQMSELSNKPQPLAVVKKAWQGTIAPVEGSYLCVIGSTGQLMLHTLKPEMVGTDVGQVVVDQRRGKKAVTVLDLLKARADYGGLNRNFRGMLQLAGYAWYEPMNCLVVTHIPVSRLDAQIHAAALPWGISLGVLTGCFFPLALLLLHTSYVRAERVSNLTRDSLASSEQQLEEKFAELELVYRLSPVGLCFVDTELKFVRINDVLAAINGPPVAAHIGKTLRSVLPEIADVLEPLYRGVLETGDPVLNVEITRPSSDGSSELRHYIASYFFVPDHSGKALGVCAVVQDITDQKHAAEQLRLKELAIRSAVTGICFTDLDGRVTDANPAFIHMWRAQSVDQLRGMPVTSLGIDPEKVQKILDAIRVHGTWEGEDVARRLDGSSILIRMSGTLLVDGDGQPVSLMATFRDITEQKRGEDLLRKNEERFQRLLSSLDDVVWSATPDGQYLYLNQSAEAVYGMPVESCMANPNFWLDSIVPEDRSIAEQSSTRLFKNGASEVEYRILRPDGGIRWLFDRKYLVRNENGVVSIGGIATDITERKRIEEALRRSDEELHRQADELALVSRKNTMVEMAGEISHELNQPISAIANYAAVCMLHLSDQETERDRQLFGYVQQVRDIAHEAGQIIRRMREFTYQRSAPDSRTELGELIRTTVHMMQFQTREHQIQVDVTLPEVECMILADEVAIRQVIVNVLQNAIDSMSLVDERPRNLTITLESCDATAVIHFHDQGIGIPVDCLESLFEPGLSTKRSGTGIGLAICTRIVNKHRGSLDGWNNDLHGATFRLTLPFDTDGLS